MTLPIARFGCILLLAAASFITPTCGATARGDTVSAVSADAPADAAHPATTWALRLSIGGRTVPAQLLVPSGPAAKATVLMLPDLNACGQDSDVAQTLRRAGWTVVYVQYAGACAEGPAISQAEAMSDVDAALRAIHIPVNSTDWAINPARIVLLGDGLGATLAMHAFLSRPGFIGLVLLSPKQPAKTEMSATALPAQASVHKERVLVVSGTHDSSSHPGEFESAIHNRNADLSAVRIDDDAAFSNHRIMMQTAVLGWLEKIPGAPTAH